MFQPIGQGEEKTAEKKTVNLNVVIQAGVNIIGSKNVIVFNGNGKRGVSEDDTKGDAPSAERKRKAESVSCHHAHRERGSKQKITGGTAGARRYPDDGG